jgi:ribonuclease HI
MPRKHKDFVAVHADESCLGNGTDGANPGGAGSMIEVGTRDGVVRRDVQISSPDTTNNRMALAGAIATFALLSRKGNRFRVLYVSDSEYVVKGMTEWVPAWIANGWRRRGGKIENLALWQKLVQAVEGHEVNWQWVRGHAGHVKNEYANDLAVSAAQQQVHSAGAVPSSFEEWLVDRQARGHFTGYDADADFTSLQKRMTAST